MIGLSPLVSSTIRTAIGLCASRFEEKVCD